MGKGDVTLKFGAEDAEFIQKTLRMRAELEATANAARTFGDEAGKAGEKAEKGFHEAGEAAGELGGKMKEMASAGIESLGLITSAAGAVGLAVETLMEGISRDIERTEQRASAFLTKSKSITESLAASGQVGSADQVAKAIAQMSTETFSGGRKFAEEDVTNADKTVTTGIASDFAAISDQLGPRATPEQKIAATHAALLARASGSNDAFARNVGINYGLVSVGRQEGETDDDLLNTAFSATVFNRGPISDKQLKTLASLKDRRMGLQMILAGAQGGVGSKLVGQMEDEAMRDIDPVEVLQMQKDLVSSAGRNDAANGVSAEIMARAVAATNNLQGKERVEFHRMLRESPKFTEEMGRKLGLYQFAPDDRLQAQLDNPELVEPQYRNALLNLKKSAGSLKTLSMPAEGEKFAGSDIGEPIVGDNIAPTLTGAVNAHAGTEAAKKQEILNLRQSIFAAEHPTWDLLLPKALSKRLPTHAEQEVGGIGWGLKENRRLSTDETLQLLRHQAQRDILKFAPQNGENPGASADDPHAALLGSLLNEMRRNNDLNQRQLDVAMRPPRSTADMFLRNNHPGQA